MVCVCHVQGHHDVWIRRSKIGSTKRQDQTGKAMCANVGGWLQEAMQGDWSSFVDLTDIIPLSLGCSSRAVSASIFLSQMLGIYDSWHSSICGSIFTRDYLYV